MPFDLAEWRPVAAFLRLASHVIFMPPVLLLARADQRAHFVPIA